MSISYAAEELDAIAGWLGDGFSASQIVVEFHHRFRRAVTRNAIIGIVHRNKRLAAIGLGGKGPAREKVKQDSVRRAKRTSALHVPALPAAPVKPTANVPFRAGVVLSTADTAAPDAAFDPCSLRSPPLAKILADLAWTECRWPVNDARPGEDHLFCAAHRDPLLGPYCAAHAARAGSGYTASQTIGRQTIGSQPVARQTIGRWPRQRVA